MVGRLIQKENRGGDEQSPRQGHSHAPPATHVFAFLVDCGTAYAMRNRGEMEREIATEDMKTRRKKSATIRFKFLEDS
jgi:hypothetical protein